MNWFDKDQTWSGHLRQKFKSRVDCEFGRFLEVSSMFFQAAHLQIMDELNNAAGCQQAAEKKYSKLLSQLSTW